MNTYIKYKTVKCMAADLETVVDIRPELQTKTAAWSSAFCPIHLKAKKNGERYEHNEKEVIVHHSLDESWKWLMEQKDEIQKYYNEKVTKDSINITIPNILLYYHNLKFDGDYWLNFIIRNDLEYITREEANEIVTEDTGKLYYTTLINKAGSWFNIVIYGYHFSIEFRDSLKLLPMKLEDIGKGFETQHKKLSMEYTGLRYPGCKITDEEMHYIKNDVLVLAEGIEIMYSFGFKRMTISGCAMDEFKKCFFNDKLGEVKGGRKAYGQRKRDEKTLWNLYFPNLGWSKDEAEDEDNKLCMTQPDGTVDYFYGEGNTYIDTYIRRSYKGGWCYSDPRYRGKNISCFCKKGYRVNDEGKLDENGKHIVRILVFDVNSLYPSMMESESGNRLPIGRPVFFKIKNNSLPPEATENNHYYFIRLKLSFRIKKDHLPFIQIKGNSLYKSNEMLRTSATRNGNGIVEMIVTMTDWELIQKHYDVFNVEMLDGCWFNSSIGIFDSFIRKFSKIKQTSTGAKRLWAKLVLNSCYGRFGINSDATYKEPYLDEDGVLKFETEEDEMETSYVPIASAITSYARRFTITAAQKNYKYFCYSDTDSIHLMCPYDYVKGVKVHPTAFNAWKLESMSEEARFIRQKTYFERMIFNDKRGWFDDTPKDEVKCAGMPESSKDLYVKSMTETDEELKEHKKKYEEIKDNESISDNDKSIEEFLSVRRSINDFDIGLTIPSKLMPKHIEGGCLLVPSDFTINEGVGFLTMRS